MSDIETIKARIRKLMAVAGDGVAPEGEIDNAMRLAAKLLDEHHLAAEDVAEPVADPEPEIGQAYATSQATRFSTWEAALADAVANLFGSVQLFRTGVMQPVRVNGIVQTKGNEIRRGNRICFYGPLAESKEAADLFEEWSRSIAAMGVARWGGCFRGDGAMYCYGFAVALLGKSRQINQERAQIAAKPIGDGTTAITLAGRYEILRNKSSEWLRREQGIHLVSSKRSGGYSGDSSAFDEGRKHGAEADFGRTPQRKRLM